jgi:hypothetical protein
MKFGRVAWLLLAAALQLLTPIFGQDCPLENAFLWGRKTGLINPSRMETLAGLAASRRTPGVLWAHDSGQISRIFALATTSKAIDDFTFDQTLIDAEDIAVGPGAAAGDFYIYLADCGGVRSSVVIARFAEPLVDLDPHTAGVLRLPDQSYFTLNYPDGAHDARGLMVDPVSNDLFLVTYETTTARVYRAAQQQLLAGNSTMTLVGSVPIAAVTAADISADGSQIALRSASMALRWIRHPGQTIAQALATAPHVIPILDTIEVNGDSLTFAADGSGYYTTSQGQDPPLLFFERNTTRYTSGVGLATIDDSSLAELSGVAASRKNPGLLWVHNDGPRSELYLWSTNGLFYGTFTFSQAMSDFEDIAIGPGPQPNTDYVYGGDIGDNTSIRTEIHVFRFPEPRVTQSSSELISVGETVITLVYPDGAHDAEGLLVDPITGDLFIASKEIGIFHLYKATQAQLNSGDVVQLALVQNGAFGPVSGGDISPDGTQIVLRYENEARLWQRRPGESVEAALGRVGEKIPVVGIPLEPNGEGISFAPDSRSYYTISEGVFPVIYFFEPLAQPKFSKAPEQIPGGVRVTVSGCEGSRIRLDASSDLVNWTAVGSGEIVNGVTTIDVPAGAQMDFYRAVVDGP